ncbi:phosphoribosylaminoimidazole-succinocarboxamide synthase [Colletotrichum chrysophilum]|uniref:Phosphoribosylaminoimidazole-succinocarboxamide synthase n=1 Tax=Colletotrichum chrysophilum TaxID=1836956 RepID=A0AAD9AGM2_9PEZI|nr:phosphoribosylaminoimidazole-succinocarboxamide synthase [Colletotrichum chrysophilum]
MANPVTPESSPGSQPSTQTHQSQRDSGILAAQTLQEPTDRDSNGTTWKKLDYRPSVLRTWALLLDFIFNCAVIAGLVTFHLKRVISVNTATYYGLNALLIIVGTGTVMHLESLLLNLSRITPFILCARKNGALASDTILGSYFPSPTISSASKSTPRNWLLLLAHIVYWPSYAVIGLKSAILYEDYTEPGLFVNLWACYTLLAFYSIIQTYLLILILYFWKTPTTGLRWDPVSIADVLSLFRHSDFLNKFEGSSIANRQSINSELGDLRIRLGYWTISEGTHWHGFALIEESRSKSEQPGQRPAEDQGERVSQDELARIRYLSAWAITRLFEIYGHSLLSLLLMILFILGITLTRQDRGSGSFCFEPALSTTQAIITFDTVLTTIVGFLADFWISIALFVAHTEPLARMNTPQTTTSTSNAANGSMQRNFLANIKYNLKAQSNKNTAKHTLLLNYTCSAAPKRFLSACQNKHWKVARVSVWAALIRLMPTLVGSSITVYHYITEPNTCLVCFTKELFIVSIIGFAMCSVLILFEVLKDLRSRRMPRDWLTIGDLVSWASTSDLLGVPRTTSSGSDNDSPWKDPLDVAVDGEKGKQWYMQERLKLQLKRYCLGYSKVPGTGHHAFGIKGYVHYDVDHEAEQIEQLPPVRVSGLLRRLTPSNLDTESRSAHAAPLTIVMRNMSHKFTRVDTSEYTRYKINDQNIVNTQNQEPKPADEVRTAQGEGDAFEMQQLPESEIQQDR